MNDDDPVIREIEETDRWLWKEGGETMEGLFSLCHRLSQQAFAEYDKHGRAWRGLGRVPAEPAGSAPSRQAPRRRGGRKDAENAVCVHEDSPKYRAGETSGSARDAGVEGEG